MPAKNLNKLRAAVLGSNDGIVSVAGIIAGVAGATDIKSVILTAGTAGVVAGALSMATGEYVSVSSQRDSERSHRVPRDRQTSPVQAAVASALSFVGGAAIPLLAVIVAPNAYLVPVLLLAVLAALIVTGLLSAIAGGARKRRATIRTVIGGLLAVTLTYVVGSLFHI